MVIRTVFTLEHPKDNAKVNKHGKDLLSLCKAANLIICNGRLGLDKGVGKFTCFTSRGRGVVDYLVASHSSIEYISNFDIDPLRVESDHCPVVFTFKFKPEHRPSVHKSKPPGQNFSYYKWDSARIFQYYEELTSNVACEKLADFLCMLTADATAEEVCDKFYAYLDHEIGRASCRERV